MNENGHTEQAACLRVLHLEQPQTAGDCFVEVRQWETADGERRELIAEYGRLDETGELVTTCQVMPFFLTVGEVLQAISEEVVTG